MYALIAATVIFSGNCGKSTSPTNPTPPPASVTLAAPALRAPVGGVEIVGLKPTLEVTNSVATGEVGSVTYRFEISEAVDFPTGSRTVVIDGVAQGASTTSTQVPFDLQPARLYHWRARATNGTVTSSFSATETLRTENLGFRRGLAIYDPLTNGATVADERHGGHFVTGANGGWQADGRSDSLDYNIPTCSSCQVEFDATNFAPTTPGQLDIDPKWFSMGDGSTFDSFLDFRQDPWKMHIEKRTDVEGAVKLIWRRGCNDDDDCDNANDPRIPIGWDPTKVYHFTFIWGGGVMSVNICEYNGSSCGLTVYSATGTGSYAPPNHRIEIGTRPRSETIIGARFRNVTIGPR